MARTRPAPPNRSFMDSLFASLEASGMLNAPAAAAPDAEAAPVVENLQAEIPQVEVEGLLVESLIEVTIEIEAPPAVAPTLAHLQVDDPFAPLAVELPTVTKSSSRKRTRRSPAPSPATPSATAADSLLDAGPAPRAATAGDALTISALSTHILALFERDTLLRDLWVVGEVSNWKRAGSGHIYFSLKDAGATISAVMWRTAAMAHGWLPSEGDQVLVHGYVGLYPERGSYQLYANQIRPVGRGQLFAAFEALKARLAAEGLFAPERKRPLPSRVARIGIITSRDGAALRDILRVVALRWPLLDLLLFPTVVQGGDCPAQLCAALANANRYSAMVEPLDLIILARGGGSIEDLWGFNDEQVARAIAASALPVISGVGHETDFTIADFVADLRAATPSAAAMAASPDGAELVAQLAELQRRLAADAWNLLDDETSHLEQRRLRLNRTHPERALDLHHQRLDERSSRLEAQMERRLQRTADRTTAAAQRLAALNPLAVLQRGYSIVQGESGQVVLGPDGAAVGERLQVRAAQGSYAVLRVDGESTGESPAEPPAKARRSGAGKDGKRSAVS